MKLLIDSHVLVWMLYEPERLGKSSLLLLEEAVTCVSAVSLWELSIKHLSGKLAYSPRDLAMGVGELHLTEMPLQGSDALQLAAVKIGHKDPFDRLLLAQAMAEDCTFLTADNLILSSGTSVRLQNVYE